QYVQRRHGGKERTFVSVVHRLDKETSGILVFARSRRGLVGMQAQLRAHTMDRRYRAVVEGDMSGEAGTYDRDLVAEPGERRRGVAKEGEPGIRAVTEWTVIERFGIATLVEARLKTGRTHQIRIHFANAGHVLVGDSVYRDRKEKSFPVPFPRQALHAGHLGWATAEGKKISLDADPPADFLRLLEELRKRKKRKISLKVLGQVTYACAARAAPWPLHPSKKSAGPGGPAAETPGFFLLSTTTRARRSRRGGSGSGPSPSCCSRRAPCLRRRSWRCGREGACARARGTGGRPRRAAGRAGRCSRCHPCRRCAPGSRDRRPCRGP